jgi:hypothetical protein
VYTIYWDAPGTPIGDKTSTVSGQIDAFTYTVPVTATQGIHQVVVDYQGTVVAQAPFDVTP